MDKRTLLFMLCVSLAFFGIHYYYDRSVKAPQKEIVSQPVPQVVSQNFIPAPSQNETFYVLENEYQQLVFSSRGGGLAEINLPFQANSPKSIVKEIDIDREIASDSPNNARFPLYPYSTPTKENQEGKIGGYYPLLRRGVNQTRVPPEYYALNIVGGDAQIANTNFQVTQFQENSITFQGDIGGTKITKTYTLLPNGPYCFQLDVNIDGNAQDLWLSSGVPDVEIVSNSYSPLLRIQVTKNRVSDVDTVDLPKKGPIFVPNLAPNWISNCNGFFGIIMDPLKPTDPGYKAKQIAGNKLPTRLTLIDPRFAPYKAEDYPGYSTLLPLKNNALSFRIFAGPYDHTLLKQLDDVYEDLSVGYNPDYTSAMSIQGWFSFISQPFSKFLSLLLELFYAVSHSWAVSIILLTIALKVMMFPLNNWSIKSQFKMQQIAPKVKTIQEKHKKDPKKAQLEVMQFYKQSGVNPLVGCFPMLLQMPFLFGMFYLLKSSFPLRGAVFIPGWIDDLATPDVLFTWNQHFWFIGNELHLLPILVGLTMYLQQKCTSSLPTEPSQMSDMQKQQKMMGTLMPILLTFLFYNFPAGLNIYFIVSTLLGIAQQVWMTKKLQVQV